MISVVRIALGAVLSILFAASAKAEPIGACAWAKLNQGQRESVLTEYKAGISRGMAALQRSDASLKAAAASCADRADLPALWVQGAIGSQVIQEGAARHLASGKALTRAQLDAAWTEAPAASQDCVRNNAAKVFRAPAPRCSDPKASLWFLRRLKLTERGDREAASQALIFYNAKAQSEIAEALLARFSAD